MAEAHRLCQAEVADKTARLAELQADVEWAPNLLCQHILKATESAPCSSAVSQQLGDACMTSDRGGAVSEQPAVCAGSCVCGSTALHMPARGAGNMHTTRQLCTTPRPSSPCQVRPAGAAAWHGSAGRCKGHACTSQLHPASPVPRSAPLTKPCCVQVARRAGASTVPCLCMLTTLVPHNCSVGCGCPSMCPQHGVRRSSQAVWIRSLLHGLVSWPCS